MRVALPEVNQVVTATEAEITANVNSKDILIREAWRRAEYVDDASEYKSWVDIRRYGYSCRAFVYINRKDERDY